MIQYERKKWKNNHNRRTKNKTVWIEEVHQIIKEQNLEVLNLAVKMPILIENKTIIDYVEQYMKENDLNDAVFD